MSFTDLVPIDEISLVGLSHYHQSPNVHPGGTLIPPGWERIELMTGGRGWILHEEEWREVLPCDLIWNKPGDCTIGRSDFENPYRCLAISFQTPRAEGLGLPRFSRWPVIEEVESFTRETIKLFFHEHFERKVLCHYVLSQILFRMELHRLRTSESQLPEALRITLTQIERNFGEPCRIDLLAQNAGCSPAHLHALFRKHLQNTPHQWLINRRLRAAREKLEATYDPIKQIASECGFPDTAAFTNTFRRFLGMTPSRYRIQARSLIRD